MIRCLILLLSLLSAFPAAQGRFVPLGTSEGLGSRKVYQVAQDGDGYLWFYSQGSIDRFDGFSFRNYKLGPEATEGNYLATSNTLTVNPEGIIHVVQTNGRVYRFQKDQDAFELAFTVSHGHLYSLLFDENETWLGTSDGLFAMSDDAAVMPGRPVNCLIQWDDSLIAGTDEGVYKIDGNSEMLLPGIPQAQVTALQVVDGELFAGTFSLGAFRYDLYSGKCASLGRTFPHVPVRKIIRDGDSVLFGTDGAGVVIYDTKAEAISGTYKYNDADTGLSADTVSDIGLDSNGTLWVTTTTNGICHLDRSGLGMRWIKHVRRDKNSLVSDHVNAVLEDSKGRVWFGTNTGLCRFDGERWKAFEVPGAEVVITLDEDAAGTVWAGCYGTPVFSVDASDRVHILNPDRFHYTFAICTENMRVWIADINEPLTCYDISSHTEKSYLRADTWDMMATGDSVWLASHNGLGLVRAKDSSVDWKDTGATEPEVWSLDRDAQGRLWLGMQSEGVIVYDPSGGPVQRFHIEGTVQDVLAENSDNVMAVTEGQIYRLDPSSGRAVVMNRFLGIDRGEFNTTASVRLRDGRFIVGSAQGALIFDPSGVDDGEMSAINPEITEFKLLTGDTQRVLKGRAAGVMDKLVLKAQERSFSLSFSALELARQERIHFDYQLEGHDPSPRHSLSAGTADYSEVRPGHYKFVVRAIDSLTGSTLGEKSLPIVVRPPALLSGWAFLVYSILVLMVLWLLERNRRRKVHRQMVQERLDTFIHFAHELKTPVSLIKGPLMVMDKDESLPEPVRESVSTAVRNSDRLMSMINSLLDLRQDGEEEGRLELEAVDTADYLGETIDSFRPLASRKGIELKLSVDGNLKEVLVDRGKMDRIVQNLVSNAVKYTETGSVSVSAQRLGRHWSLVVKDTGIGIPEAARSRIFNGGVRAANARNVDETGYGIGLMVTRQLVTMHHGTISLQSTEGSGSTFTLLFPMEYKESEASIVQEEKLAVPEETAAKEERPSILIVEDDAEMLRYLSEFLGDEFNVLTAVDGTSAIKAAEEQQPDLVLSDLVMPEVDGYALCRHIKSTLTTSHIPVILLTAMDDKEHVIMGLEAGADDYVIKPFDPHVLKARVSNLLHERERLRALVLQAGRQEKKQEYTNRLDKEFMEKVLGVLESSYSNPEFQIDDFCRSMAMSRTAFFNKLKALSGQGPNDFIRIYRLNKAKLLLESGQYTIAEVADEVGFSDAKYFSSCFKRAFGVSPSKY